MIVKSNSSGHDFFSHIGENEQEKEQAIFKQHIDQIQVNLTSSILQEQASDAGNIPFIFKRINILIEYIVILILACI